MNLPPLPELPLVFTTSESDIHKLMREYGALCRKMALEEAAQVCEDYPAPLSCNRLEATLWDVATTSCADKIRELK